MIKKILLLLIFLGSLAAFSQNKKASLKVHTFSEMEELQQQKSKPILVFIYSDWCKICHGMQKTTLKNNEVIQLLNENFYFVKLNGEEKKDIHFLVKTFVYKPTGTNTGIHELANELASKKKRIAYPTTTILNSEFVIDEQLTGFYNSKKMTTILNKYISVP
jgi:thioredoxin-related protein